MNYVLTGFDQNKLSIRPHCLLKTSFHVASMNTNNKLCIQFSLNKSILFPQQGINVNYVTEQHWNFPSYSLHFLRILCEKPHVRQHKNYFFTSWQKVTILGETVCKQDDVNSIGMVLCVFIIIILFNWKDEVALKAIILYVVK